MRLLTPFILTSILFSSIVNPQKIPIRGVPLSSSQPGTPFFENAPCMFDLPQGATIDREIQCGYLHVPEEYNQPEGPTIRLAVAILKSPSADSQKDPLVLAQGGPGGSTIETYVNLFSNSRLDFVKNRDIILLEQRGTLYSDHALMCPEILDETIQTLDQDLGLDESLRLYEESISQCHQRLVSSGVNLPAFDSYENARDFESLRNALELEEYNLYGVSYGTLLALHIMRNNPAGLRSVILDAVVPPEENFILKSPLSQTRAFKVLFSSCQADPNCNQDYPDLEKNFWDTVDRLNEKPAEITLRDPDTGISYPSKLDGDGFRGAVFQMLYITEIIPYLPRVIQNVQAGDFVFLERILSQLTFDRTMSYGLYYSVLCAEDSDFSENDIQLDGVPVKIRQYEKANILSFLKICSNWNLPPLGPSADAPVETSIPTLILNGNFDPITPPDYGEEVASHLRNSVMVTFPGGGHSAAMTGECPNQIIQSFLDDPEQKPDTACVAAQPDPTFITNSNTIFLPVLGKLMAFEGNYTAELLLLLFGVLFLISAPPIWFFIWVIQKISGKGAGQRRGTESLLHWVAVLNGVLFTVFIGILLMNCLNLALENNILVLFGLPSGVRPLFILPLIVLVLTVLMVAGVFFAWQKRFWSPLNRIYYSALTLTSLGCILLLSSWGLIFAFFQ